MSDRKPIFFTSDWHCFHDKALQYDERPFKDMTHMIESLITRFNATVPENGVCYFLGDIGNKPAEIKKVIDRLNGTKVLVMGNHDKGMEAMYNAGFDVVVYGLVLYHAEQRITVSHCPLLDTYREDCSKMTRYEGMSSKDIPFWHGNQNPKHRALSFKNEGQFHISGHIHSRPGSDKSKRILGRQFDVGVCGNNYTPVSWPQIQSWVDKTIKEESK
jgi:calcineurin-like phosphoesterase family protein